MDIDYKTVYQAGPTDVLDILTDLNFLRDCATELGADSHEADVCRSGDSRSVTLRLIAPTDEIDAVFKSLVVPRSPSQTRGLGNLTGQAAIADPCTSKRLRTDAPPPSVAC